MPDRHWTEHGLGIALQLTLVAVTWTVLLLVHAPERAPLWTLALAAGGTVFVLGNVVHGSRPRRRRRTWICSDCLGNTIFNRKPIWATQLWCYVRRHYRRPLATADALARRDRRAA